MTHLDVQELTVTGLGLPVVPEVKKIATLSWPLKACLRSFKASIFTEGIM